VLAELTIWLLVVGPSDRRDERERGAGVLGFQSDGGFYVLHSTPKFPTDPAKDAYGGEQYDALLLSLSQALHNIEKAGYFPCSRTLQFGCIFPRSNQQSIPMQGCTAAFVL
jgi:hypothetical protein